MVGPAVIPAALEFRNGNRRDRPFTVTGSISVLWPRVFPEFFIPHRGLHDAHGLKSKTIYQLDRFPHK